MNKLAFFLMGLVSIFSSCQISDQEETIADQVVVILSKEYDSLPEISKFKISEIANKTNFKLENGNITFNSNIIVKNPKSLDFYGEKNFIFYQDDIEGDVLIYKDKINYIDRMFNFGMFIGMKMSKDNSVLFKFIKKNNEICFVRYTFNEQKPVEVNTYNWP